MCDRAARSRVEILRGFMDHVAAPLFRSAAALLPGLAGLPMQVPPPFQVMTYWGKSRIIVGSTHPLGSRRTISNQDLTRI